MKKSLIAAAVAAAIAVPTANAGVTIYGKINAEIVYESEEWSQKSDDRWRVTNRSSRLGFKGTEDLGNGLKAIWKMEGTFDIVGDKGNNYAANRNAYIGLSGGFGTFFYGRHDTPYKSAYYSTGIDKMDGTVGDLNALAGFHEVRAKGAIAYISPNMSGFTVAAAIIPGQNLSNGYKFLRRDPAGFNVYQAPDGKTPNGHDLADAYSMALMYKGNGIKAALAYEDLTGDNPADHQKLFFGIGGTIGPFELAFAYQDLTTDIWYGRRGQVQGNPPFTAEELEATSMAISAAYSFGNTTLNLAVANIDVDDSDDDDITSVALGINHKLSKRTSVHAVIASVDTEIDDGNAFSTGIVHLF